MLVLGGYGGFGGRISERLAALDFDVLVAGRSEDAARRFCQGRSGLTPAAVNRDVGLREALADLAPWTVVDAAGPFQGTGYDVPRACIEAGCHYLDIADARAFVLGVSTLDAAAKAGGVSIVSGASSVPALSGAVVRALASGMNEVRAIEIAISASSRASAGRSVTEAILSYVGKPIRLWRGGRWETGFGWSELRRQGFEIDGHLPILPRLVGLADVPDLDLLPDRVAGRPTVTFRAGAEYDLQNRALGLAGWLVRLGWLADLRPFAPIARWVQQRLRRWGSDRSGMVVRLFGQTGSEFVEHRWTLIAEQGCGPEIPCLAAPILLTRLRDGALIPGARDAGDLLSSEDFTKAFAPMPVLQETRIITLPPPLYAQVMGDRFMALPQAVRRLHEVVRDGSASGRAEVTRERTWAARAAAALFRFPAAGEDVPVHVAFTEREGVETWTRDFAGRRFQSRLSRRGPLLIERFGPLRFGFELPNDDGGLSMSLKRWRIGPLPLPTILAPHSPAREWAEDGVFQFDVPIRAPLMGLIVRYRGWLKPD